MLWIGWLQQHYRNHSGHPAEPILQAHGNIRRQDAVLDWDGAPAPRSRPTADGHASDWPNPRRPPWPEADFIIGNPPFIGGKDLRSRLEPGYAEALWRAHPQMNDSADLVMYWWDRAADILTTPGARLRRFGFVTTNSITQVFQRRTIERWTTGPRALSLVHAIADHPWTRVVRDSAAVRIAMTVAKAGLREGELATVVSETDLDTDAPLIATTTRRGRINPDLTVGADVTRARALQANAGLCSPGMKLHGSGFIVSRAQADALGLGRRSGLEAHIRPYRNGRDLTARSRDALVIDLYGLAREEVRDRFPEVYAHLVETVKEARDDHGRPVGRDVNRRQTYRENWWLFGEPRGDFRPALDGLQRYIATVETTKHRVFQFLDADILPDNMLVCIAIDDPAILGVLNSRAHGLYALRAGGWLGVGNDPRYSKSRCFDPFPFPALTGGQRARLAAAGEALDAHRKQILAEHPDLTLTGLYNLLDLTHDGAELTARQQDDVRRGRIVVLRDLHAEIDRLTIEAYGWPADQTEAETIAALAGLNRVRDVEESRGQVRWLRPEFQRQRAGVPTSVEAEEERLAPPPERAPRRPAFPTDRYEQPLVLQAALARELGPVGCRELASRFSGGVRLTPRIDRVLTTLHRYGHVERLDDGRWISARA